MWKMWSEIVTLGPPSFHFILELMPPYMKMPKIQPVNKKVIQICWMLSCISLGRASIWVESQETVFPDLYT